MSGLFMRLHKVLVRAAVCGLVGSGVAQADPADPGSGAVQTLTPSRPSTPALDEQFLADLTKAGMRITDVPTAIAGAHDTCAYLAAGGTAEDAVGSRGRWL